MRTGLETMLLLIPYNYPADVFAAAAALDAMLVTFLTLRSRPTNDVAVVRGLFKARLVQLMQWSTLLRTSIREVRGNAVLMDSLD